MSMSTQNKYDVLSTVFVLGGLALLVVAAEAGLPAIAALGATASVGSGLVRVLKSKPKTQIPIQPAPVSNDEHNKHMAGCA